MKKICKVGSTTQPTQPTQLLWLRMFCFLRFSWCVISLVDSKCKHWRTKIWLDEMNQSFVYICPITSVFSQPAWPWLHRWLLFRFSGIPCGILTSKTNIVQTFKNIFRKEIILNFTILELFLCVIKLDYYVAQACRLSLSISINYS